jgi:hypothetical protein
MSDTVRAGIAFGAIWLVALAAVLGAWSLPVVCAAIEPMDCSPRERDTPAAVTLAALAVLAVAAVVLVVRDAKESVVAWLAVAAGVVGLGGAAITALSAGVVVVPW